MIQRLQKRFIAVTMLAVFLVLLVLIGAVNIINYRSIATRSDLVIDTIAKHDGMYPMPANNWQKREREEKARDQAQREGAAHNNRDSGKAQTGRDDSGDGAHTRGRPQYHWDDRHELERGERKSPFQQWKYFLRPNESRELPFEIRYFTITLNAKTHKVMGINSAKIHSVDEAEAVQMAKELAAGRRTKGYRNNFRYQVVPKDGVLMVICLERTRELSNYYTFLTASIFMSLLALLLVFILVRVFSRRAVRPIAESYEKQKEFITNAGHELKTPLAIIQSCTDVVEMENGESKWTQGIHDQVGRLSTMTEELVTLSRMDESAMNLEKRRMNYSDVAEKTLEPFALLAEEQGKTLHLKIAPDVELMGNERTLKQLCSILADNAVKYSCEGSDICIALKKKGHKVTLETRNRADGLKKGNYSHLFDRFYRGDTSHNSEKAGYGIGLSMAQSIVQGHGGKITAVSRDGESLEIIAVIPDDL